MKKKEIANYAMTFFRTLTKEEGSIDLSKYYELTRDGYVKLQIEKIRACVAAGDREEVDKLKKRLPSVTPAALFRGGRKKEYFVEPTCMVVLDHDDLDALELQRLRQCYTADAHVLMVNVSPSGRGLKVLVAYGAEEGAQVPREWDACKAFYTAAFNTVQRHYARLYRADIDPSGKDLTRLNFLSYDPQAYLNAEAEPLLLPTPAVTGAQLHEENAPETKGKTKEKDKEVEKESKKKSGSSLSVKRLAGLIGSDSISFDRRRMLLEVVYNNLYRHKHYYLTGHRHHFMLLAAHSLNNYGIPEEEAKGLVLGSLPLLHRHQKEAELIETNELQNIVHDIYTAEKKNFGKTKIDKKLSDLIIMKVEIERLYILRRNTLSDRIEYIRRTDYEQGSRTFEELNDIVLSDLKIGSTEMGSELKISELRTIVESSFVHSFDPIRSYLDECPPWDGKDHIAQMASFIEVNCPERFLKVLKMWYVGMVRCALEKQKQNQIMLILYTGAQGEGKTTCFRYFLPPELRSHFFVPKHQQIKKEEFCNYIAHKMLILIDEVQKLDNEALDSLDVDISIPQVDYRQPYGYFSRTYPHVASFGGTCNDTKFMNGPHGNRRYHVFEVSRFHAMNIDYQQLWAQVKHLIDTDFKYYFTADEQDELAAYSHQFENNNEEFEMVHKYIRIYPTDYYEAMSYRTADILVWFKHFKPEMPNDRSTINRLVKALKRKKIPFVHVHNGSLYSCYLLTAEQVEYIERHRDMNESLDVFYDKYVPLEILVAHREATIADIEKANEFLKATNDLEKAKELYNRYLKESREIS